MADTDLDKLEAAKAESTGEERVVYVRGVAITIPPKLDALGLADACRTPGLGQTAVILEVLVGRPQYDVLLPMRLDDQELGDFLTEVAAMYGLSLGESSASGNSSANGSRSSRRTSKGSTRST